MENYIASKDSKVLTRVTIEQYDNRYTVESIYSDDNTIEMLMRCINACAVASSWPAESVIDIMQKYIDEQREILNIKNDE